jgi:DNA-directed RNA polymerase subunit RPC12/RpoP
MPTCPYCGESWAGPPKDGKSIYQRRADRREREGYCSTCGTDLDHAGGTPNDTREWSKYPECPECGDYLFGPVGKRLVRESRDEE